jgi:hypothetical protein
MTCSECELLLAKEELTPEAQAHLDACAECRGLAAELRANAAALSELREEALVYRRPVVRVARRPWKWAVPVAAALVLAAMLLRWRMGPTGPGPGETPRAVITPPPALNQAGASRQEPPTLKAAKSAAVRPVALRVKMLTPDPEVTIYWLIESSEQE